MEPTETGEAASPEAGRPTERPGRWRPVAVIPHDGVEPPANLTDADAQAVWATVSSVWHPGLLARSAALPRYESVESAGTPEPDEVRVVAAGAGDRLPSGHRLQAADAGIPLLDGELDRDILVRRILACLDDHDVSADPDDPIVRDFLALGTARWWLRDLTIAMGHADCLDAESLEREVLAGARAWRAGDRSTATNRLRAAFELLTQARERFYPVDSYVLDLCLLDPSAPAGALADALEAHHPVTFLAPARAIEALERRDPDRLAQLRAAVAEGWVDVIGGSYGEADEPLRPIESVLWQFRRGAATYRRMLDDRNTETLARRRFGLYPQLPQIAKRLGFRFAVHFGLDAGRFPIPPESKKLWESPDGSYLETLTRPPISADSPGEALRLPWRIARSMKDDHVATVPVVHWPSPLAGWFLDYRRMASYSPVLARSVMASDYFHMTDRPFETLRPELDDYKFPYLTQAVANRESSPISKGPARHRMRARLDAVAVLLALRETLRHDVAETEADTSASSGAALRRAEDELESGRFAQGSESLGPVERAASAGLSAILGGSAGSNQPGYLVLNPLGVPRRAAVLLPEAAADLRPEGPLRAAQLTEEGVRAVVDLPAFGYAWIARESGPGAAAPAIGAIGAKDRTLRNELMEVDIDEATGGIRAVRGVGESTARLGQQLAVIEAGGSSISRMRADRFEVEYGGPALVQAVCEGTLNHSGDGRVLARFRQEYRLWSGRPTFEIDVSITSLDPAWLAEIADADPWRGFLSCRWAWPDPDADLRRTHFLAPHVTTADRPETPDVIDISTRRQRTALHFGGLAHHVRHGSRMLDTVLIAGREAERRFRLGVALDLEYPFHAAQDFLAPVHVLPATDGPPHTGPTGWFFQVENKSVAVTRLEPVTGPHDARDRTIAFHLLETSGRAARCRLRLVRDPVAARQTDFQGELLADLPIEGDTVLVDLTPHEFARVVITFDAP